MRKAPFILLIGLVCFLSRFTYAQFINRGVRSYINYGWVDFKNYREIEPIFPRYDDLGNFLLEGFNVYQWEEYRTISPLEGSIVFQGRMYQDWFSHLIIANEQFDDWSTRLTAGSAIQTTFTPLTLDMARLNGVRFDLASSKHQFTAIASPISEMMKPDPMFWQARDRISRKNEGVHLLGGHWESKFFHGCVTVGATLVNMFRFDASRRLKDNSFRGVALRYAVPDTVVVRFTDDSPEDGKAGAAVFYIYALAKVKTNGKTTTVRIDPYQVSTSPGVIQHPNYLEASGEYSPGVPVHITYYFPMPPNTVSVEFVALVANDYRVYIRQSHHFEKGVGVKARVVTVTDKYNPKLDDPFYPFFIIRRAEGNIQDMSNKRIIRFSYGMLTGLTTFGFNIDLRLIGFHLRGEYNRHLTHYQYPVRDGGRSELTDAAYYLTLTKDIKPFTLGAELFAIGPKYNAYDYDPKGPFVAVTPPGAHGPKGPFWYFHDKRQIPWQHDGIYGYNNVYPLVDDNDDNDIWPDDWRRDWETRTPTTFRRWPYMGIFPGVDKDQDQWPDYNVNDNTVPDWDEPFLQYFVDPIRFQYGDDNNNNFIIDDFEDDLLPQYPYYKDEKGQHFFVCFNPWEPLKLTIGNIDIRQIAGGGYNKMAYGKLNFDYSFALGRGKIWYEHMVKRVKDNIPNDWYEFALQEAGGVWGRSNYIHTKFEDPMNMRNSLVHRGYLEVRYQPIKRLNIINKCRYEFNFQRASVFEDGTTQPEDRLDFIGLVNKIDYTFQYKNFTIMPRIKYRWELRSRKSLDKPHVNESLLIPILRVDWRLTPRTFIKMGIQGLPLLEARKWDRVERGHSFIERDLIIALHNTTHYQGYKVVWELGWESTFRDYEGAGLVDDIFSRFFVRVYSGIGVVR